MSPTPPPTLEPPGDDSLTGDTLARDGHWQAAVSSWAAELGSDNAAKAESRLRWFVETAVGNTDSPKSRWKTSLPKPFLTCVAAALIGTAAVLLGESVSSPWNHALAAIAWLLFALAAVCGLVYAKRHGPERPISLTPELVSLAEQQATLIDGGSATIDDGTLRRV